MIKDQKLCLKSNQGFQHGAFNVFSTQFEAVFYTTNFYPIQVYRHQFEILPEPKFRHAHSYEL